MACQRAGTVPSLHSLRSFRSGPAPSRCHSVFSAPRTINPLTRSVVPSFILLFRLGPLTAGAVPSHARVRGAGVPSAAAAEATPACSFLTGCHALCFALRRPRSYVALSPAAASSLPPRPPASQLFPCNPCRAWLTFNLAP